MAVTHIVEEEMMGSGGSEDVASACEQNPANIPD
eukprot:CAMPEP_0202812022 /NCGR_PEP_ID=MMETSP1389-20130828/3742_1 /ASSEMBLY_ACC=CAM_ASM_000865 /TAXON_ID=302021 /ORGANISM="Rhodomonas sp., Strain CCMP768" /LENGTH=33 /DNA_ID= /DNA_START= /DNA_END= /DNA_ORIENTATION=